MEEIIEEIQAVRRRKEYPLMMNGTGKIKDVQKHQMLMDFNRAVRSGEVKHESPSWRFFIMEKTAAVFAGRNSHKVRNELLELAAAIVAWIEYIDALNPKKQHA